MPAFATAYDSRFASEATYRGRTVMLVDRTLAALLEATTLWPSHVVLEAAYDDQDQVSTIWRTMSSGPSSAARRADEGRWVARMVTLTVGVCGYFARWAARGDPLLG